MSPRNREAGPAQHKCTTITGAPKHRRIFRRRRCSAALAAMSKKKAVTTMRLKDFHGGSIPSELPLPSAPGVAPRPTDRSLASAPPVAAAAARPRVPAASVNAAAAAAAVPSFLTSPARIGRHFDEDERTPFEPAAARRPLPSPSSFPPSPVVPNARSVPGCSWGPKREVAPAAAPVSPSTASGQIWSASRVAPASALENVISGRWNPSKPLSPPAQVSVPVETPVALPEMERPRSVGVRELVERGMAPVRPASHEGRVGEARVGEVPERPKLKLLPRSKPVETLEPSPTEEEEVPENVMNIEAVHDMHQTVMAAKTTPVGVETDSEVRAAERPRLNLKPRSNLVGQSEEVAAKEPVGVEADSEVRLAERPRLNLKPRSNLVGQSEEVGAKERKSLFGGARPREQVLKERGIDALAIDIEKTSPVGRPKNEFAKVEQKAEAMSINSSVEKADSFPSSQRGPRISDRKDYKRDTDRADAYRPRREDSRKVTRDVEKPLEPETWRKPVEPPKPEVTAPRFGKTATALELAQAFSRPMSDNAPQSRLTSVPTPRVPPSPGPRDQAGFSRLADNRAIHSGPSQRKINGY